MSAKPLNVTLKLSNLHCVTETDQWGGSAEPYIWTVFFKIDGDLVTHNFHPTVVTTSGNQADLPNQDVDAGENNPIPAKLGLFNTTLKPLPLPGKEGASIIGCVAVVMEQDDTAAHAIAKGHAALNAFVAATLQKFVDKAVSTGQMPTDNDIKG
ncbi:MAG TPA: hypothetical protein VKQ29_01170, partial [Aliidongia sp.]|nr:hypothetical protein [Aliidongia sp.]